MRSAAGARRHSITSGDTSPRLTRYPFLDSIRGLAAVYVVLYHLTNGCYRTTGQYKWAQLGHYSVSVFIVLSGFCLMLPVAVNQTRTFPSGLSVFIKRRARRVLPPYYAALNFQRRCGFLTRASSPAARGLSGTATRVSRAGLATFYCCTTRGRTGISASTARCGLSQRNGRSISSSFYSCCRHAAGSVGFSVSQQPLGSGCYLTLCFRPPGTSIGRARGIWACSLLACSPLNWRSTGRAIRKSWRTRWSLALYGCQFW